MQLLVSSRLLSNVKSLLLKSSESTLNRRVLSSVAIPNRTQVNEISKNYLLSKATKYYDQISNINIIVNKRIYSSSNLPAHTKIRLPALSPTMEQGTLARWVKKEGDQMLEGDLIAEIETDKATMGLEANEEGFLAKIIVSEKTKDIPLKTLLCIVVRNKNDVAAFANYKPDDDNSNSAFPPCSTATIDSAPKENIGQQIFNIEILATPLARKLAFKRNVDLSLIKGTGPKGIIRPHDVLHFADNPYHKVETIQPAPVLALDFQLRTTDRVFATPYARKLAANRNIDLSLVHASGPDGQIRADDVIKYKSVVTSTDKTPRKTQNFEDIPLNNVRAIIAKRLLQSKQTIPHYYLTIDFEIDKAIKLKQELNEQLKKENIKLSINDLVIKAAALTCRRVPECNSAWMDTFIRKFNNVDISVAVSTDNGLITPIVFSADKKGLKSIMFDVASLAQKARNNKLKPQEFQGGSFTISNLGMFGINHFAAVINPPQSCILAVGEYKKKLVPDEKEGVRLATMMSVTLSCDHRVVDGAEGAKWLDVFKEYMQNPINMLL